MAQVQIFTFYGASAPPPPPIAAMIMLPEALPVKDCRNL